jgi:hypothetical protein
MPVNTDFYESGFPAFVGMTTGIGQFESIIGMLEGQMFRPAPELVRGSA